MPGLTLSLWVSYLPSLGLLLITSLAVARHSTKFSRFALIGRWPVVDHLAGVISALLAALMFPFAFFTVGAFGMVFMWDVMFSRLGVTTAPSTIALTAAGVVAAVSVYVLSLGVALVILGTVGCILRHGRKQKAVAIS